MSLGLSSDERVSSSLSSDEVVSVGLVGMGLFESSR